MLPKMIADAPFDGEVVVVRNTLEREEN